MPSLSDPAIQTTFANGAMALWPLFSGMDPVLAIQRFSMLANTALTAAGVPRLTASGGANNTSAYMSADTWSIRYDLTSVRNAIESEAIGSFIWLSVLTFHEARHAEQFYRIAQALFMQQIGTLPTPSHGIGQNPLVQADRAARAASFNTSAGRIAVVRGMLTRGPQIKQQVLADAESQRALYDPALNPLVDGWYKSFYGVQSRRAGVIKHLNYNRGARGYTDPTAIAYMRLAEEVDAYAQQRAVNALLKARFAHRDADEAFGSMAALFG